ncbi:MAG: hypothetical protein K8E24_014485 [Methanobacterium paludis]|nr:hypothetical protein [Methanobacterium paludis]
MLHVFNVSSLFNFYSFKFNIESDTHSSTHLNSIYDKLNENELNKFINIHREWSIDKIEYNITVSDESKFTKICEAVFNGVWGLYTLSGVLSDDTNYFLKGLTALGAIIEEEAEKEAKELLDGTFFSINAPLPTYIPLNPMESSLGHQIERASNNLLSLYNEAVRNDYKIVLSYIDKLVNIMEKDVPKRSIITYGEDNDIPMFEV